MAQTFIKIAVDDHSDNFKILTVEGNSVIEFTDSPRPLVYVNGVEHLVTGVVDVLSESGHLISSYYPPENETEVPGADEFKINTVQGMSIEGDRWLLATAKSTYIADAIKLANGKEIKPSQGVQVDTLGSMTDRIAFPDLESVSSPEFTLVNAIDLGIKEFEVLYPETIEVVDGRYINGKFHNENYTADIIESYDYNSAGINPTYIPGTLSYSYRDTEYRHLISTFDKSRSPYERVFGFPVFLA